MARWARDHWKMVGLWAASVWLAYLGVAFWLARSTEHFFPLVWPAWFIVAGVLTAAFACRPRSWRLYRLSGAFAVLALASRVPSIITNMVEDGFDPRDWVRIGGVGTFAALTFLYRRWWSTDVLDYLYASREPDTGHRE